MRLNLGCGGQIVDGWVNVDRAWTAASPDAPIVTHDLTEPLPWRNSTVEAVVIHHVLALMEPEDAGRLLVEVYRVLEPGGFVRISDADLAAGVIAALRGDPDWFAEPRESVEESVGYFITQGGARRWWVTVAALSGMIRDAGFRGWTSTRRHGETSGPAWLADLDGRERESFYVEAMR